MTLWHMGPLSIEAGTVMKAIKGTFHYVLRDIERDFTVLSCLDVSEAAVFTLFGRSVVLCCLLIVFSLLM